MVELSKDGIYSSEPHINHTLGIGPNNLTDVTLCHRFRVSYLKPVVSYMVSYASSSADNTLTTNFEFDRASRGSARKEVKIRVRLVLLCSFFLVIHSHLALQICKYGFLDPEYADCAPYVLKNVKVHLEWHHICGIFEANQMNSNMVETKMTMYFDGKLVFKGWCCVQNATSICCNC